MLSYKEYLGENIAQIMARAEAKKKQSAPRETYVSEPKQKSPPPSPKVVYTNPKTKQQVIVTGHVQQDREHRAWWDSYKDSEFTKFVDKGLEKLNSMDREELKYKDEWAILSKDKTRGMIISLRYTNSTDKNDSFAIVTILNSKAKDSASNKEVFVNVDSGHKIMLTESQKKYNILCTI